MTDNQEFMDRPPFKVKILNAKRGRVTTHELVGLKSGTVEWLDTKTLKLRVTRGVYPMYECVETGLERTFGGPIAATDKELARLYAPARLEWNGSYARVLP